MCLKTVGQISTPKVRQNQNGGNDMTHQKDNTTIAKVLEELIENGTDGLEAAVSILIQRSHEGGAQPGSGCRALAAK